MVIGEGDADQAFQGPKPQGVANETDDVVRGFDGQRLHVPFPFSDWPALGVSQANSGQSQSAVICLATTRWQIDNMGLAQI